MGLFSFIKSAGEKIFGGEVTSEEKAQKILEHINSYGLETSKITVEVEGEKAIVSGEVESLETKQKVLVSAGNVEGISDIEDNIFVSASETETNVSQEQFYTVVSGDYLSKISKKVYGDANKYNVIFEANKPMLSHPDKIYPGQVLVIPSLELA